MGMRNRIETEGDVCLSSISIWEAFLAMEKGRIDVNTTPEQTLRTWLNDPQIRLISIDSEVAMLSRTLEFAHSDPADRFIAATAYSLNADLATVDENLLNLTWLHCVPAG